MNNLKEIPGFVHSFSGWEVVIWISVVFVAATAITAFLMTWSHSKKSSSESFTENITYSSFFIGSICAAFSLFVFMAMSVTSNNHEEIKTAAHHNIAEIYNVDFKKEDLKIRYHAKNDQKEKPVKEAYTTYDDLDTGTRYELIFVFKDSKEPVLLKTSIVTDEFIAEIKK